MPADICLAGLPGCRQRRIEEIAIHPLRAFISGITDRPDLHSQCFCRGNIGHFFPAPLDGESTSRRQYGVRGDSDAVSSV